VTTTRLLIAIGTVLVLGAVNYSILGKERIKSGGELVFIELGPRDPRSLMQGDYMALRFPLAQRIAASWADPPREGEVRTASITLNEQRVAALAAAGAAGPTLPIRYRVRNHEVWLGTNAFFFEEGSEKRFAPARYGEFRLDPASGEAVLVGLRDAKLNPL
jgi:uncharacterized membrane-anchored protein